MKKILGIALCLIALFAITGCEKENKKGNNTKKNLESIVLEDKDFGYTTTFYYEKGKNYSEVEKNDSGKTAEISFKNEDLDVEFQMYYSDMRSSTYDDTKEARSKQKYYKEYQFGKYDAYAYGEYSSGIKLSILIADEEDTGLAKSVFVSIDRLDTNEEIVVADLLEEDELQDLFNSIQVEKTK